MKPGRAAGPCPRCEAEAARLARLVPSYVDGTQPEPDAHLVVRELDAAIGRLLSCPGPGKPGCVAHEGNGMAQVVRAAGRGHGATKK